APEPEECRLEVLQPTAEELKDIDAQIEQLNQEKETAVAEQDFEKAAHLRDQADKLKKKKETVATQSDEITQPTPEELTLGKPEDGNRWDRRPGAERWLKRQKLIFPDDNDSSVDRKELSHKIEQLARGIVDVLRQQFLLSSIDIEYQIKEWCD